MSIPILDLTRQYAKMQDQLETAVCEQMRSGAYIGGKAVTDFEQHFAEYIGVKHAIALNSGTDALIIALKALDIRPGDEIITTPFTFFATAETVAMVGAVPVFADIDEETYNIDPDRIEEKITEKTKAILPVHIFGQPADMDAINRIAKKHHLYVIEDACQAVGSAIGEKKIGSVGDIACFSFFPTKNLGAFGDGGMITTDNDDLAVICRAYREHGSAQNGNRARFLLQGKEDVLEEGKSGSALYNPYKYYNYLIAYNSRLDAIQARVLDIKLKYLDGFNARRTEIAGFYNKAFADVDGIRIPAVREGNRAVWHQYAFRCARKDDMGAWLANRGIGSAAFYPVPLHLQKAFDYLNYRPGDLPVAEKVCSETVCLPIFPELTDEELSEIVEGVVSFFE